MATRRGVTLGKGAATTFPRRRVARRPVEEAPDVREDAPQVVRLDAESLPVSERIRAVRFTPRRLRNDEYMHVSDLLRVCTRQRAIHASMGTSPSVQVITLGDAFTFAQGDAIHDTAKELLSRAAPGEMWGKWSCKCGTLRHNDPCLLTDTDQEEVCPYCGTKCNEYQEVSIRNEEYRIVGNPDVLMHIRNLDAKHITEVKSIAASQFSDLNRPLPEHVIQAMMYWWLMREAGHRITSHVSIFYITKGWVFGSKPPYKEFLVDAEASLSRLDPYLKIAKDYKESKINGQLPPRTCTSTDTATAKGCEVCRICFATGG